MCCLMVHSNFISQKRHHTQQITPERQTTSRSTQEGRQIPSIRIKIFSSMSSEDRHLAQEYRYTDAYTIPRFCGIQNHFPGCLKGIPPTDNEDGNATLASFAKNINRDLTAKSLHPLYEISFYAAESTRAVTPWESKNRVHLPLAGSQVNSAAGEVSLGKLEKSWAMMG